MVSLKYRLEFRHLLPTIDKSYTFLNRNGTIFHVDYAAKIKSDTPHNIILKSIEFTVVLGAGITQWGREFLWHSPYGL